MTKSLSILAILSLMVFSQLSAQEIIEDKIEEVREVQLDSTQLIKIDGVAAVIGDFVVLDSDIEESEAKEHSARLFINDCTSLLPFDLIHPAATTSKK